MAAVAGIRGSGNWETDQRIKSWREGTLLLEPNGETPLYGLTSKLREKQLPDPEHNWWTKALAQDIATVTGIYETSALADAYDASDDYAAGTLVYAKMTAANITDFKPGHVVRFMDASGEAVMTPINGRVMERTNNGANSFLVIKLLEADGAGTGDLSTCDQLAIIGPSYAEASAMPQSLSYNPTKRTNYTQIFIDSLRLSRTARKTRLRTGDQYQESKRETLQYHKMGIEMSLFFGGPPAEGTDSDTGLPERRMGGLEYFIKTYASSNIVDYTTDTDYSGVEWVQGGEEWLDYQVEQLFRYGTSNEKLVFCGPGSVTGINRIAKAAGIFELNRDTVGYGIKVKRYETAHGDLLLMKHPLFNKHYSWLGHWMFAVEPKNITYGYIDDTMFVDDKSRSKLQGGAAFIDGLIEGYVTECTLEVAFPEMMMIFKGVGQDNTL